MTESSSGKVRRTSEAKSRIVQYVHKLIYHHWVDPLQKRIPGLSVMKPGWRQHVLMGSALWGANLGRLAITDFRVHIRRWRGAQWSVVYIGAGFSSGELRHILFPTSSEVENLGHVFLWQAPALAKQFADQGELVVCERNPIIRWRPQATYVFTVPCWIKQVLDIGRPMDSILAAMNQNMRRNLRKMEKQGFSYTFTQEQEDFDLFYHRMYRPYIQRRYGTRFNLAEYDPLRSRFKQGGLILVKRDQEPICGMLCRIVGDTCEAGQMGVQEEHFDLVSQGANVALWWLMMDWARCHSLGHFDFGASRAQTADGAFNFKRQWGTRVFPLRDAESQWIFYSESLSLPLRHHLNEQGFITVVDSSHYQVVLLGPEEGLAETELARKRKWALDCGLSGLLLISPQTDGKESSCTYEVIAEEG